MPNEELYKAIGEISQANRTMSESLKGIESNLKTLNDYNILHNESAKLNQQVLVDKSDSILDKLRLMGDKYWWLIIVLLSAVFIVMGYKEVVAKLAGG